MSIDRLLLWFDDGTLGGRRFSRVSAESASKRGIPRGRPGQTYRRSLPPTQTDENAGFHYEFSNEFYALWLDPTMTYSCAYFERSDMTLEEAQMAKVDLAFRKIGLRPGHRVLDVGCGWGATAARGVEKYGASAVGLTLSQNQLAYAQARVLPAMDLEYRLEGWETYQTPCDRIVSCRRSSPRAGRLTPRL